MKRSSLFLQGVNAGCLLMAQAISGKGHNSKRYLSAQQIRQLVLYDKDVIIQADQDDVLVIDDQRPIVQPNDLVHNH